jgi:hypothetical protein
MQITDPDLIAYLNHRGGEHKIHARQQKIDQKALELNTPSTDFASTFGKAELPAYIGFIDLAGFSSAVNGKRPIEIARYLKPFLSSIIGILRGRDLLIDKTIGDEVMFVLPETEEEAQSPEVLFLGQAMGGLHDLAFKLNRVYKYRIGLAYGQVSFFKIEAAGYSEWTVVGEAVQLAKRLHSLCELKKPDPVIGAFGMQVAQESISNVRKKMEQRLSIFAGFASRFSHQFADNTVSLKGVGDVLYAILLPRPERVSVNST